MRAENNQLPGETSERFELAERVARWGDKVLHVPPGDVSTVDFELSRDEGGPVALTLTVWFKPGAQPEWKVDTLPLCAPAGSGHPEPTAPVPAPSAVMLRLPTVPLGTVALVGVESGRRWIPYRDTDGSVIGYRAEGGPVAVSLAMVFDAEGGKLRAELRQPRTWPAVEPRPGDVTKLEVVGRPGVWTYDAEWSRFISPDRTERRTWAELRALGEVREVLS